MKFVPLSTEERLKHGGATHKATVTHADLTEETVNTAQTIELFPVVAKDAVKLIYDDLVTAFEDQSDAAFNSNAITVGDGGDLDRLLASQQVNVNGTEVVRKLGTGTMYIFTDADTVDLVVGSMAAKALSDIDKGELDLYFQLIEA
jgi:hypothetical protein